MIFARNFHSNTDGLNLVDTVVPVFRAVVLARLSARALDLCWDRLDIQSEFFNLSCCISDIANADERQLDFCISLTASD